MYTSTQQQQPHHGTIDNRSLCTANPSPRHHLGALQAAWRSLNIPWGREIKKESRSGFFLRDFLRTFFVAVVAFQPTVYISGKIL